MMTFKSVDLFIFRKGIFLGKKTFKKGRQNTLSPFVKGKAVFKKKMFVIQLKEGKELTCLLDRSSQKISHDQLSFHVCPRHILKREKEVSSEGFPISFKVSALFILPFCVIFYSLLRIPDHSFKLCLKSSWKQSLNFILDDSLDPGVIKAVALLPTDPPGMNVVDLMNVKLFLEQRRSFLFESSLSKAEFVELLIRHTKRLFDAQNSILLPQVEITPLGFDIVSRDPNVKLPFHKLNAYRSRRSSILSKVARAFWQEDLQKKILSAY
jgi:hypothetical protein